jgi:uncharacterized membrane protein YczE
MSAEIFIGLVTVAVVDAAKDQWPKIKGKVTVLVAGVAGGLLALLTQVLAEKTTGLPSVSIAVGVAAGLAAAGTVGIAKRVG